MKRVLINIFKTLFFFDLAVICFTFLPSLKTENLALLKLGDEGFRFLLLAVLSFIFINLIERRSIKLPLKKIKFKQALSSVIAGAVLPVIAVAVMLIFKGIQLEGFNKISHLYYYLMNLQTT